MFIISYINKLIHGNTNLDCKGFFYLIVIIYFIFFISFPRSIQAEELMIEEVVRGRNILFIRTIYPFNSKLKESLKNFYKGVPKGISVDPDGKLYAIFYDIMKIQVFDSEGRFQYEFGQKGFGEGKYIVPLDIEIANDGKIYLLDSRQNKILIYDNKGRFLSEFTIIQGISPLDKEITANKIGLDRKNSILYVSDNSNSVIRRFSLDGKLIDKFGHFGHKEGEFSSPGQVTFDNEGNLYVVDMANSRVQVLDKSLKYKFSFGSFGDSLGEFVRPNAICLDSKGRIYVLDRFISAIQVFDKKGKVLGVIKDLEGLNLLKNAAPFDMTIDYDDRIYISAQDFYSIKVIKDLD